MRKSNLPVKVIQRVKAKRRSPIKDQTSADRIKRLLKCFTPLVSASTLAGACATFKLASDALRELREKPEPDMQLIKDAEKNLMYYIRQRNAVVTAIRKCRLASKKYKGVKAELLQHLQYLEGKKSIIDSAQSLFKKIKKEKIKPRLNGHRPR